MKVTMIGTGYVGLVSGACLADVGNDVLCFDVDARKIAMLEGGEIPIYEPGLREIVRANAAAGRLTFTTDAKGDQVRTVTPAEAVKLGADYLVIGRPITRASDPVAVLEGIRRELGLSQEAA